jgi:hypothetical protein
MSTYYERHRERILAQCKRRYLANKEEHNLRVLEYRRRNPDKWAAYQSAYKKRWLAENPEKNAEYSRVWRESHPEDVKEKRKNWEKTPAGRAARRRHEKARDKRKAQKLRSFDEAQHFVSTINNINKLAEIIKT